jgi:hypothetical protein
LCARSPEGCACAMVAAMRNAIIVGSLAAVGCGSVQDKPAIDAGGGSIQQ